MKLNHNNVKTLLKILQKSQASVRTAEGAFGEYFFNMTSINKFWNTYWYIALHIQGDSKNHKQETTKIIQTWIAQKLLVLPKFSKRSIR